METRTQCTPGPWEVRGGVDEYFIDSPGQVVCLAVVNKCVNNIDRAREAAANAALIAAAPDLLEMLENYERFSTNILERTTFSEKDFAELKTALAFIIPAARTTIANATGKEA